jgi:DNA-binding transcriptional MerR regulator
MSDSGIGPREVARATNVSTDTLRHYERKGLLTGVHRTPAGYRRYPAGTVNRVLLIQRALVVGFTLNDLKRILSVREKGGAPCRSVRVLLGERLNALNRQIDDLEMLRNELRDLLTTWDARLAKTPNGERAHLLETLGARDTIERARRSRQSSKPDHRPRR